jgi:hypothetical protein
MIRLVKSTYRENSIVCGASDCVASEDYIRSKVTHRPHTIKIWELITVYNKATHLWNIRKDNKGVRQ